MIPYDELVSALSQWRARNGLGVVPTRAARLSAQTAAAPAPTFAPGPALTYAAAAAVAAPAADDPFAAAAAPLDDYDGGEGTELHDDPGVETGEIDIDSEAVDVIDEQLED